MRRIPQPPVNPALRDREMHDFWPPFVGSVLAIFLIVCGARNLTGIETVEGGSAWETQLVKAYSTGGLKFPHASEPPPPVPGDPAATAAALERWERETTGAAQPVWRVRVDPNASTPCPT